MELDSWPEGDSQAQGGILGPWEPVTDVLADNYLWMEPLPPSILSEWHLQDNEFMQATSDTLDNPSELLRRKFEELLELEARLKESRADPYYSIRHDITFGHLAQTYSSGATDYTVKALVGPNRHQIDALPDTGAKRNFVSQRLVKSLGLVPKGRTKEKFRLPSGATFRSCGTVDVPFTFLGESEHHLLDCCILPKCTQDLILSQTFLKATGTLTKFAHRITKSLREFAPRFRFNLIEDDTCCLQGSFDDIPSIALADTGCDAMLISADFARRHSLEIDTGVEHRHLVEYADGSLDTTTGIIRDSTWQFRSSRIKIPCDFYVLDDLKADIVLSSHFIFQHEIFSQFEGDIIDMSLIPERDFGDLYNIRLISHYSSALRSLEASSIADMNSPGSFSPGAIKAERVRRDQIRDAINALPLEQQDQARIDERNRQEIWDGYRRRHLEKQEEDTDSAKQVLVAQKERWWEKGLVWRRFGRRAT
ncbi:uncharacterized protein FFB20_07912 [Fusarium fujikuroi]|uniref:Uncharacterized protein n=1 Tax=Fusarium fujikuroi TaxID=5127 RepID=A0A2H3RLI7_FUSFU|nr:uncharacterized protein FFB20_07912 [Fusarium fujikuroi]SCN88026.1 uncharacterized protein FFC1_05342 [Fusarium fujikuroi]SCN92682.1 uncharacterized protein FFE2_07436 [Fusarium fujikuroi]SCO42420.1 uncharacterized protein FFNC_08512 [Fusarium fujikuroi]SCV32239.1 uncharacterized protein FFFS_03193 [Fusarium fujikuroi]